MILLAGAITSLLVQGGKWLIDKLGYEMAKITILISVFALSLIFALLKYNNILTPEFIQTFVAILTMAIATYELILKNIIKAYDTLFKKE